VSLSKDQQEFTRAIGLLINYATSIGYGLTFGDAYAEDGHQNNSFHYHRLAVDFNLFVEGKYCTSTEGHMLLGVFWENLGGTWGGRFKNPDGNHYSWGEGAKNG